MSFPLKGENILQLAGLGASKTLFTAKSAKNAKEVQKHINVFLSDLRALRGKLNLAWLRVIQ
jgi:hypothetical protein